MASPIPTTFDLVLAAVQARLMAVLEWPEERVVIDARTDAEADEVTPVADQFVRLRLEVRRPDPHSPVGRGRVYPELHVDFACTLRTRYDVDAANSDQTILTDATRGHLRAEHDLWDALWCFQPADGEENWLVREPIQPGPATAPRRPPKGWMSSTLSWESVVILDLDQAYQ